MHPALTLKDDDNIPTFSIHDRSILPGTGPVIDDVKSPPRLGADCPFELQWRA